MSGALLVSQFITGVWLLTLVAMAIRRLRNGNGNATLILTCVHFLFFGIPIWLDVVFGLPDLVSPGFVAATAHPSVSVAYCLAVAIAPLLWQWAGGASTWASRATPGAVSTLGRTELALLFLPVLLVFVLGSVTTYSTYGTVAQDSFDEGALSIHSFVAIASLLTIATVAGCVSKSAAINMSHRVILVCAAGAAFWVNGKRAIIAIATLWIGYALWGRRRRVTIPMLVSAAVVAVVVAGSLVAYQAAVRGIVLGERGAYLNARIDYGRDFVLKQALLAEIEPGREPVLEYRGQSFVYYATLFVPRSVWPDKPWPYAIYQTSRMLGIETRSLGWGTTTSWLDESVANFGLAGIFIGPLILGLFCRIGHAAKDPVVDATTTLIAILFLTVHLAAFYPLAALWGWQRLRSGRAGRKQRRGAGSFVTSIAVRGGHWRRVPALNPRGVAPS
jgi:hypothetical protein